MTDIARPSNPALSFSSFNDEPVAYRMKAYPDRIEVLSPSPRTTITSDSLEASDDDGRSKSAPPNPLRAQFELDRVDEVIILASTHDPRCFLRPDSAPPLCGSPNVRQTMNEKNRTKNPEIGVIHVAGTPALRVGGNLEGRSTASVVGALFENPNNNNSKRVTADCCCERTNAEDINNYIHHQSSFSRFQREAGSHRQIDGRQLSRPIAKTPSRISASQQQYPNAGGTLILRPNPVKPAEITTTNLSPADLVRAAATATLDQVVETPDAVLQRADEENPYDPKDSSKQTASTTITTTEEKKVNETRDIAAKRQADKEAKRKIREAQQQRKQEFQVDFPENTNATFEMPSASGHKANEEKSTGHSNQSHPRSGTEVARIRQTQQQNHRDRMNSLRASSGGESLANRDRNNNEDMHPESARAVQPTPLFERLVTEEVQELKTYAGIVERQNVELAKQKKVQEDLEARLRAETRRRKELESLLEEQERLWSEKFVELEQQRDAAEKKLKDEETKTKKLINQVQRKDRDIHDFFKKKVSR